MKDMENHKTHEELMLEFAHLRGQIQEKKQKCCRISTEIKERLIRRILDLPVFDQNGEEVQLDYRK